MKAWRFTGGFGPENLKIVELPDPVPGPGEVVVRVRACSLTADRLSRLRRADAVARRLSHESGYDHEVWQFPVILIPLGTEDAPDSVVLRPVDSVDGMTAQSVLMEDGLLRKMCCEILEISGVAGVFYDLTHKPPGTIEWE